MLLSAAQLQSIKILPLVAVQAPSQAMDKGPSRASQDEPTDVTSVGRGINSESWRGPDVAEQRGAKDHGGGPPGATPVGPDCPRQRRGEGPWRRSRRWDAGATPVGPDALGNGAAKDHGGGPPATVPTATAPGPRRRAAGRPGRPDALGNGAGEGPRRRAAGRDAGRARCPRQRRGEGPRRRAAGATPVGPDALGNGAAKDHGGGPPARPRSGPTPSATARRRTMAAGRRTRRPATRRTPARARVTQRMHLGAGRPIHRPWIRAHPVESSTLRTSRLRSRRGHRRARASRCRRESWRPCGGQRSRNRWPRIGQHRQERRWHRGRDRWRQFRPGTACRPGDPRLRPGIGGRSHVGSPRRNRRRPAVPIRGPGCDDPGPRAGGPGDGDGRGIDTIRPGIAVRTTSESGGRGVRGRVRIGGFDPGRLSGHRRAVTPARPGCCRPRPPGGVESRIAESLPFDVATLDSPSSNTSIRSMSSAWGWRGRWRGGKSTTGWRRWRSGSRRVNSPAGGFVGPGMGPS